MNVEKKYFDFLNKYVVPFVKDAEEKEIVTKRLNGIYGWALAAKGASASVIGRLLAKYKNDCFIEIWKYNYNELIDMILRNNKKTIIFTALVPTAEYIYNDLIKRGIDSVKITGESSKRINTINEFKKDENAKVLVATTQTLGVGVTITEANQILFFGTPYRSADFDQAIDRIHRIGQTDDCYIYNVLLFSKEKNITDRIEEIMNWSDEMFNSLLTERENKE